ncbi:4-aminobutyrate--2-oxoglutarate transaminase [Marinisporobacter balticus]|uniref:(S)-3-amino-2-methylpropionate transaminase n=1 Tax=Marinisporobacter balticus TaxID=2018667 RepID=A0A4R2L9R9_9FIRM|nr:4-aminobutyrate--2-oxoglutarate transaminase [Marinisporobacter balticus]TCO79518.1 4-aminobutyrate aminotransferase/(S)-3-amino-2-methylpropionate transaminase [Marinisporobacter balticus]
MSELRLSVPKMVTELPGRKSKELLKLREENVPGGVSYGIPTFIKRGEGAMFEDVDGNIMMDFAGGLGVLNIGYSHPEVVEVVKEQCEKFFHTSINIIQYEQYIRLAEKLNRLVPGDFKKKTMLVNSGAEANENAIKIARRYTGRSEIVTFTGAFHGRTSLTMALTSKVKPYKFGFGPFSAGIHRAEFPYIYRRPKGISEENAVKYFVEKLRNFFLEEVNLEEVAAIIIEPVQGEGGFITAPMEYVKELRKVCDENGILLICDEVQSGYCRTGRMFACDYWAEHGIYTDIMTSAKSIAGGLPLSAVTARAEIIESSQAGGIGGTYCGNPVAATAALKVIEIMERDNFADKANHIADIAMNRLNEMKEKYEIIGDVRGLGAMMAIELVKDQETKEPAKDEIKEIIKECNKQGLVVLDAGVRGNNIRFLMPLVITDEQLNFGLDIIENAIVKVCESVYSCC